MLRFDHHLSDSGINESSIENESRASYTSALSGVGDISTASSTKAVLAALRALQDKIRRLEAERSQALDETAQLRHQLRNQEIEAEHSRQREGLSIQKSLQETRTAYDRLLTEKTELEIRLSKIEGKNRENQMIAEELRDRIKTLEEEKHSGLLRIKDLEGQLQTLETQVKYAQQREKDLTNTMLWETKRHDTERGILSDRHRSLQEELGQLLQTKSACDAKILELDELVGQLLAVNETLVYLLSTKPKGGGGEEKKHQKTSRPCSASHRKGSTPSRHVSPGRRPSTPSSPAPSSSSSSSRRAEIEHLKGLHNMYVNIARTISNNNPPTAPPTAPPQHSSPAPPPPTDPIPSSHYSPSSSRAFSSPIHPMRESFSSFSNSLSGSGSGLGLGLGSSQDLGGVISSLEDEFESLNSRYKHLLSSVKTDSLSQSLSGSPSSPGPASRKAEELIEIIQQLHRKGEQLRALKSPSK